jgi:hypothetical protein
VELIRHGKYLKAVDTEDGGVFDYLYGASEASCDLNPWSVLGPSQQHALDLVEQVE